MNYESANTRKFYVNNKPKRLVISNGLLNFQKAVGTKLHALCVEQYPTILTA